MENMRTWAHTLLNSLVVGEVYGGKAKVVGAQLRRRAIHFHSIRAGLAAPGLMHVAALGAAQQAGEVGNQEEIETCMQL